MRKWICLFLLQPFMAVLLTGCIEIEENGDEDGNAENIPTSITGVWNMTTDEGSEGIDEYYLVIRSNGDILYYDYMGDTYDQGDNCYRIYSGSERIEWRSGINYIWHYTESNNTESLPTSLEIVNSQLIETTDLWTLEYPATSLLESDLSPECSS